MSITEDMKANQAAEREEARRASLFQSAKAQKEAKKIEAVDKLLGMMPAITETWIELVVSTDPLADGRPRTIKIGFPPCVTSQEIGIAVKVLTTYAEAKLPVLLSEPDKVIAT